MRDPSTRCVVPWVLGLVLLTAGSAGGAETAQYSTPQALAQGTLDGTLIDADGRLALAPEVETLWGPEEGIVWRVTHDGRGGVFAALSGPARLLHIAADGETAIWHQPEDEQLFTAVATDPAGHALLGATPSGEVWKYSAANVGERLVETDAAFVWALSVADNGDLWVGTGVPGRVLRVRDGVSSIVHETAQDPVRCLLPLDDGGVLVGTGGQGHIIRISGDGRPYVLYDADSPEIVALARDEDGVIYALAVGGAKLPGRADRAARGAGAKTPQVQQTVTVRAKPDESDDAGSEPKEKKDDKSAPGRDGGPQKLSATPGGTVYRIEPDGAVHTLWETVDEMPFAMARREDGLLVVATGAQGRLHIIDPTTGHASRLLRVSANQASALTLDPAGSIWVGATHDARIERIHAEVRATGRYLSPVVDAGTIARWGQVTVRDEPGTSGTLRTEIRVGNTESADETWSDWVPLQKAGEDGLTARRAQIRLHLAARGGKGPRVSGYSLHYRVHNRRPQVMALDIERPGVIWVAGPTQSSSRLGPVIANDPVARRAMASLSRPAPRSNGAVRKGYEPGARTFRWLARDQDGDRLRATLAVRREGGETWFPIARDLETTYYSWDARGMPDGAYRVRVTVDDQLDHPD
ncbi:MAG: SMP-30/gluconolactonase/LRE family protein, partial [Acidobacteriota bacterium]|nr:SMP-30/gluconolactonase/LRE family protein [Acidobacteriota bacterium]